MNPSTIPNFNEQEKSALFHGQLLKKLTFRVADIALYWGNSETLLNHIVEEGSEAFIIKFKIIFVAS